MAVRTFRSLFKTTGPRWLRTGNNLAILHGVGVVVDLLAEMALQAVKRRFTDAALPDALETIGLERGIFRGPNETPAHYSARLRGWRDAVKRKGNPYELLAQLHGYFEEWATFQIDLVYATGRRYVKDAAGAVTYDDTLVGSWTPPESGNYRWYMYARPDDNFPDDDAALRNLLEEWNAQHAIGTVNVLYEGSHVWGEPGLTWGASGGKYWTAPPRILTEIS